MASSRAQCRHSRRVAPPRRRRSSRRASPTARATSCRIPTTTTRRDPFLCCCPSTAGAAASTPPTTSTPTAVCTATPSHRPRAAPTPTARSRPPTLSFHGWGGSIHSADVRGTARARAPPARASTPSANSRTATGAARRAPTRARGRRATTRWPPRWRCSPTPRRRSASTRDASTPPASPTAASFSTNWRPIRGRPPDLRRTRPVGAPHAGFNRPPLYRAPFFGVWGRNDHTIPPLQNPDAAGHPGDPTAALDAQWSGPGSGWLWSTARNATALWARANGCVPEVVEAPPWVDLDVAAECVAWAGCDEAEVIECLTPGGHEIPPWRARVQWAFMQRHELPARPQPTAPLPDGWPASAGIAAAEPTVPLVVVVPVAAVAAVVGCFFSVAAGWAYRRWRWASGRAAPALDVACFKRTAPDCNLGRPGAPHAGSGSTPWARRSPTHRRGRPCRPRRSTCRGRAAGRP